MTIVSFQSGREKWNNEFSQPSIVTNRVVSSRQISMFDTRQMHVIPIPFVHLGQARGGRGLHPYPEINVEVTRGAELAIANLVCDAHLVILVEVLVEAFESVGGQDNVVGGGGLGRNGSDEECPRGREEMHVESTEYGREK